MDGFKCIIHGSFSKHFEEIKKARQIFAKAGIEVLAPKAGELAASNNGFALFEDEQELDPVWWSCFIYIILSN